MILMIRFPLNNYKGINMVPGSGLWRYLMRVLEIFSFLQLSDALYFKIIMEFLKEKKSPWNKFVNMEKKAIVKVQNPCQFSKA